jgi:hypothetical protein
VDRRRSRDPNEAGAEAEDRSAGCAIIVAIVVRRSLSRIWVPSWENRDVRQLFWHRHRMVQMRIRVMNQLQAVALNEGVLLKVTTTTNCAGQG